MCTYVRTHVYVHSYLYTPMYVHYRYWFIYIYIYIYVHTYIYIYVCIHIYLCIHICMYVIVICVTSFALAHGNMYLGTGFAPDHVHAISSSVHFCFVVVARSPQEPTSSRRSIFYRICMCII